MALAAVVFATLAQAGERTAAARAGQVAAASATAADERPLAAVSYGCGWAATRLADPSWRPFLSQVARACRAIADNPQTRQITQQAHRERAFTAALDRAARGLDALYLEMWRVRLADESPGMGTVALSDTGVFLTLQHERVFRLADRIVLHYEAGSRTAWLR
ncbi:hypothetical protein CKO28_18115 [Rhodovibrio sodomensis]|uniref:Uncharacterized protein n=1 Tax=Rhodovibrio sodomensis TaxID=1088 RepID=A0ABS1DJQ5_9PROT|nr:hypothetical protein [Rhodovibrio sodomensis]MBK1669953.1 hypothetical protein [Rhodovibrio sodomensis]